MSTAIKLRGDTTERWALNNPVLLSRETVLDTTLNKFKIGDGVKHYLDLPYTYSGGGTPETDSYKSNVISIDNPDFIPVMSGMTGGYEYQFTPGSYGVVFVNPPISGLSDINFNLKVDYSSHDGSGSDGDQDFIHTLTSNSGRVFTRRIYRDDSSQTYTSTPFVETSSGSIIDGILYNDYKNQLVEF